ncbi:hypothetical protein, partial [Rhizobium sp. Leaf383]|uniref:hypothetical protein n=1 Tax=Rhizobium sp. Leaf383 TaxID=1736357 RepID=UPI001FCDFEA6
IFLFYCHIANVVFSLLFGLNSDCQNPCLQCGNTAMGQRTANTLEEKLTIRHHRQQGGPFPGKGSAPSMAKDFYLPTGRADFEDLNDLASRRPSLTDAGSLVPANDNRPAKKKDAA